MQIQFDHISPNKSAVEYKLTVDSNGLGKLMFYGNYKRGSEGNADGFFMEEVTSYTLSREFVKSLIVDLRELDYSWGNTINNTISRLLSTDMPIAVIYGNKCKSIVLSDEDFFVKTEHEALDIINKRLGLSKNLSTPS